MKDTTLLETFTLPFNTANQMKINTVKKQWFNN